MKKPLLIIFTIILTNAFAQIPNAGFEQVTTGTLCNGSGPSYTVPTGYASTSNTLAVTAVAHAGSKAAMIASVGGIAEHLVTYDCSTVQYNFVYSGGNPSALTAWVRRAAAITNDTLTVASQTFDASNNILTAGQLKITGAGYTAYTQVVVTMTFVANGTTAKALIAFIGSKAANSSWYVDDVAYTTVGIAGYGAESFSMFYNSNTNSIEVSATQSTEENISVSIYDVVGKKIIESPANQLLSGTSRTIPTQGFQPGIYLVQVQNKNGPVTTKRIFIQ